MREITVDPRVLLVFVGLRLCLLEGVTDYEAQPLVEGDVAGEAARLDGEATGLVDPLFRDRGRRRDDERRLGVARGESPIGCRRPGLVEHGGALRRGRWQVRSLHGVARAHMVDAVDLARIGVDAALTVLQQGADIA